jgi:hypothetical protein
MSRSDVQRPSSLDDVNHMPQAVLPDSAGKTGRAETCTPLVLIASVPTAASLELPEGYTQSEYDVLTGRGKRNWLVKGNVYFRQTIHRHVTEYLNGDKSCKILVVQRIIDHIAAKGGAFLQQTAAGRWLYMSPDQASEKVGHSLRDQVVALKARRSQENSESPKKLPQRTVAKGRIRGGKRTGKHRPQIKLDDTRVRVGGTISEENDLGRKVAFTGDAAGARQLHQNPVQFKVSSVGYQPHAPQHVACGATGRSNVDSLQHQHRPMYGAKFAEQQRQFHAGVDDAIMPVGGPNKKENDLGSRYLCLGEPAGVPHFHQHPAHFIPYRPQDTQNLAGNSTGGAIFESSPLAYRPTQTSNGAGQQPQFQTQADGANYQIRGVITVGADSEHRLIYTGGTLGTGQFLQPPAEFKSSPACFQQLDPIADGAILGSFGHEYKQIMHPMAAMQPQTGGMISDEQRRAPLHTNPASPEYTFGARVHNNLKRQSSSEQRTCERRVDQCSEGGSGRKQRFKQDREFSQPQVSLIRKQHPTSKSSTGPSSKVTLAFNVMNEGSASKSHGGPRDRERQPAARSAGQQQEYQMILNGVEMNVLGAGSCDWHDGRKAVVLIVREGEEGGESTVSSEDDIEDVQPDLCASRPPDLVI